MYLGDTVSFQYMYKICTIKLGQSTFPLLWYYFIIRGLQTHLLIVYKIHTWFLWTILTLPKVCSARNLSLQCDSNTLIFVPIIHNTFILSSLSQSLVITILHADVFFIFYIWRRICGISLCLAYFIYHDIL